jgi:hypothetical protein
MTSPDRSQPDPPAPARPSSRRRKLLIAAAAALLLYAAFGFFAAPGLLRSAVISSLSRTLTTHPSIGRVRVNPLVLSVTVDAFAVPDAEGKPAVAFRRLYLRFDPLGSLARRAWTLAELRLESPAIALEILPDRTLNLVHLLRPGTAPADTAGRPPGFLVRRLSVEDGALGYADRTREPALRRSLRPVHFEVTDFGSRRDSRNAYSLEASTDADEKLAWSGRFTLQPFFSEGRFHLGQVRAKTLADFLGPQAPFELVRGTFSFDAAYRVDAARTPAEFGLSQMAFAAHEVALADRASAREVVAAADVATRGGTLDGLALRLSLGEASAHGVRVVLAMQPDGHTVFERWARAPAPAPADTARPLVTVVPSVHVEDLALDFEDQRLTPAGVLGVRRGVVDLKDFSTAPGSACAASFACSLGTGGHCAGSGTLMPGAPSADLQVALGAFDLRALEPWIRPFIKLQVTGGTVDAKGRLQFNAPGGRGPLLRFAGDASSRDFGSLDTKVGEKLLAWKSLVLTGLQYDALPGRVALREVRAIEPFIRIVVAADHTTNLQALQVPPDSIPPAFRPAPGAVDTMPVRIDMVRVTNGSMRFADLSLRPSFAIGIQGLAGVIRELSSAEAAHADLQLDGKVDAYAPAHISGTLNPLNSRGRTDLKVAFQNIELTTFTPYSGKFMGYRIQKGKLDLDLEYRIENRMLEATNHVFMRQITLGEKVDSPDATHLPVRFAVALLKDRDGNIDLNLPVKGSLDDPRFSVMPIVMKVLIGLVTKAVASPFALMHAAFGGGDHESPAVTFAFGSAELDTADTSRLLAVRKGLADKPALRLEIEEAGDAQGDSLALVARRFLQLLRPAGGAAVPAPDAVQLAAAQPLAPEGFTAGEYVESLTRACAAGSVRVPPAERRRRTRAGAAPDSLAVAAESARLRQMAARLRDGIHLEPSEVASLPRRRARRIQGFLLADSTVAPERVFIVGNKGTYRADSLGVKVGLALTD